MELHSDDPEENWIVFKDTVHSSAMDSLGSVSRKHQDWFDENEEEIQGLLEEKHQKHKAYLSDASSVSNKAAYSNTVEPQWLKHLWDHGNLFETWVVRATEG